MTPTLVGIALVFVGIVVGLIAGIAVVTALLLLAARIFPGED